VNTDVDARASSVWVEVAKYVSGEMAAAERERFEQWLVAVPERAALVARARTEWPNHDTPQVSVDAHAALDIVLARVGLTEGRSAPPRQDAFPKRWHGWTSAVRRYGIAGIATLTLGTIVVLTRARPTSRVQDAVPGQQYSTKPGQQRVVHLADGSTITVAPATRVTLHAHSAEVIGQAYFAMVAHRESPFTVRTRNAVVRVLGTAFSVRQYSNESQSTIFVRDGKVTLQRQVPGLGSRSDDDASHKAPIILTARMMAQVTDSGLAVQGDADPRIYASWVDRSLVFKGVALRDVLTELSRAYGVSIAVDDDTLAHRAMFMEIAVDRYPVTQVLTMIGMSLHAHYVHTSDGYKIVPGGDGSQIFKRQPLSQSEKYYGR